MTATKDDKESDHQHAWVPYTGGRPGYRWICMSCAEITPARQAEDCTSACPCGDCIWSER